MHVRRSRRVRGRVRGRQSVVAGVPFIMVARERSGVQLNAKCVNSHSTQGVTEHPRPDRGPEPELEGAPGLTYLLVHMSTSCGHAPARFCMQQQHARNRVFAYVVVVTSVCGSSLSCVEIEAPARRTPRPALSAQRSSTATSYYVSYMY